MIKQNMKYLNRIFVLTDAILVGVTLLLAWYIRVESGIMVVEAYHLSFEEYMRPLLLVIPTYLMLYHFFDLYSPHRSRSLFDELINLIKANSVGILLFLSYLYFFKMVDYSRKVLIIFYALSIILAFVERYLIRYILRNFREQRKNLKHIVLVGFSDLAFEYSKRIYSNKQWGFDISGVFDNYVEEEEVQLYNMKVQLLGKLEDLKNYISQNNVDEVIITLSLKEYGMLQKVVEICERQGVYTRIIPDYYKIIPAKPYIEDIEGLPVISIRKIPLNDLVKKTFKRSVDMICSFLGIIVLSPMFLLVALVIRMDSKGAIIYKQTRIGLNRHEFEMYKFRTMKLQKDSDEKQAWTIKNDPRVTRIGNFLRKTSLDEFPQLFNVLKGDMSLIGPRPERPQFVEKFKDEIPKYMIKHLVRPGMTGWAQINGLRGDTSIEKRIEYDLYYIENWSVKLEFKIFVLTFIKGFLNKNAY